MDDKHFDEVLGGKLEAFQDTAPVNEAAFLSMMEGLSAVQVPLPWYAPIKPFIIPALTTMVAGAAIFFLIYTNYEAKIEALEDELSIIKNGAIHIDSNKNIKNDQTPTLTIQNSISSEGENVAKKQFDSQERRNTLAFTAISKTKENNAGKRTKDGNIVNQVEKNDSVVTTIEWADPSAERQIAGVPHSFGKIDLLPEILSRQLAEEQNVIDLPEFQSQRKLFAIRVGANLQGGMIQPDIGKAKLMVSPGLLTELMIGEQVSLGIGANILSRSYSLNSPRRFENRLGKYPELPNLAENRVSEIRASGAVARVPIMLNYRAGNSFSRIRPLLSLGVVGAKVLNQKFKYRKQDGGEFPEVRIRKTPTFALAAMHVEAGTEVKLEDNLAARITIFYDHPLAFEGVERRKFSTVGISGSVMLGRM